MEIKNSIDLQSSVNFVNDVISVSTIDGEHLPSLLPFAIRFAVISYFSDFEFEKDEDGLIDQDKACQAAYETTMYTDILNKSTQAYELIAAAKEQIKLNRENFKIELSVEKQLERLISKLEGIFNGSSEMIEGLGVDTIMNAVQRLSNVDDKSIIDAVVEKQELKVAEKSKCGRKPGSKNKPKEDKIVQIPGQISVDELPVSE